MAVSKGVELTTVRAALDAGIRVFGESRVQEALPKIAKLPGAEWHLVGRLQANKARGAASAFTAIHSVDSRALLERLDRVAAEERATPLAYLEVNVAGDAAKAGFAAAALESRGALRELVRVIAAVRTLRVVGLMTIGPMVATPDEARPFFARLRAMRDALCEEGGIALPELSMGMSSDAEAAVAEGATIVRIGTAIFGPRLTWTAAR